MPKDEREKVDPKSKKCVLLGYGSVAKGYRLYDLKSKRSLHSRDVIFSELQRGSTEKESSSDTRSL